MTASLIASIIILQLAEFGPSYFRIKSNYYRVYYTKPYMRIPPFLIGIYLGLFLYSFRNDEREESIIKRFCDAVKNSWILRQIHYWVGFSILLILTFTFQPINNKPDDFSQTFNSFYMTFSRPVFILGFTMMLFPILLGRGKFLRAILGHDFFTPLARLSFGAYLIHATFMMFEAFNRPRATWANYSNNFTIFFSWMFVTFVASFLFTIIIETPCANLEKTFLMGGGGKKKKKAAHKKMKQVEQISFSNSFSEQLVNKDSDTTPELPRREKDPDFFREDVGPENITTDSYVKHSIN